MRVGVGNSGGALAFKAGDAVDDRERPMSDVPNLGQKFRGLMPMFSCLPSDTEQTSITSRHRRCWASPDSVSRLVAGYMCEVLQYSICRRYYVTAEWC